MHPLLEQQEFTAQHVPPASRAKNARLSLGTGAALALSVVMLLEILVPDDLKVSVPHLVDGAAVWAFIIGMMLADRWTAHAKRKG